MLVQELRIMLQTKKKDPYVCHYMVTFTINIYPSFVRIILRYIHGSVMGYQDTRPTRHSFPIKKNRTVSGPLGWDFKLSILGKAGGFNHKVQNHKSKRSQRTMTESVTHCFDRFLQWKAPDHVQFGSSLQSTIQATTQCPWMQYHTDASAFQSSKCWSHIVLYPIESRSCCSSDHESKFGWYLDTPNIPNNCYFNTGHFRNLNRSYLPYIRPM